MKPFFSIFTRKKHKPISGYYAFISSFVVTFTVISMVVLWPVLNRKEDIEEILEASIDDTVVAVGDPPDPPAYDYWYAPENSFGIDSTRSVNWSHFKQLFKNNFDYLLEYRINDEWVEGNEYLSIGCDWQGNDSGYWKINLTFTKPPSPEMDVRFTIGMNKQVLDYVERAGQYEYWINYTANNTEVYNCFFNWSDLMSIPDLIFNHGVQDDLFWFRFRKDDVPLNTEEKVYVFDPTFGYEDKGGSMLMMNIGNDWLVIGNFTTGASGGIGDNITAFIYTDVDLDVTCALYDSSLNLINKTEERVITSAIDNTFLTFDFLGTPTIEADTQYYITWYHSRPSIQATYYATSGGDGVFYIRDDINEGGMEYPIFPDPMTLETTQDADGKLSIYCSYTEGVENAAPTVEVHTHNNETTGVSTDDFIYQVWVNDTDNDETSGRIWVDNATGNFDWSGNDSGLINLSISGMSYNTWHWVNVTCDDGTDNTSKQFKFKTEEDAVTITRVSYSPTNIRINDTSYVDILFNFTTGSTPINESSILFAHNVNQTAAGNGLNFTYRILKDSVELRSDNRDEDYWYEKFNASGTGELGYHGEWGVHDNTSVKLIYVDSGSNWTTMRFNTATTLVPHLFSNIWYIDRTDLQDEIKTDQIFDIYGNNAYKAKFNMTGTDFYSDPQYNNSLYQFYYNANDTGTPNKALKVYLANASYVSGKPDKSDYCVLIDEHLDDDIADYSIRNSSYWGVNFSTNETGYVGTLKLTEQFYFIFITKAGDISNKYDLAFCDSNVSNRDYNNSDFTEYSSDGGQSWAIQNGSIDCHLKFAKLDNTSRIDYKVYANDTSGNEAWSTVYTDLIDVINVPPNPTDILTQNGTITSYNIGETVNITYKWIGDPNQDTCWVNTTCHDSDHNVVDYIENRSITHAEVEVNMTWYIDWDTTGVTAGNDYHINMTATDPDGLVTGSHSNGSFNITRSWQDTFSYVFSFSNTSSTLDIASYLFSFSNDTVASKDTFSYLYSFSNDSVSTKDIFSYLYSFSNSSTTGDVFSYLYSFSNSSTVSDTFSYIYSFSNDSVSTKDIFSYLYSFSNTSTTQDIFSYVYSFSNTSAYMDTSYLYSFSNTSSHAILEPSFETVSQWAYYENESYCNGEQSVSGVTDGSKSYGLSIEARVDTGYCKVYQENINLTNIDYIYVDFYFNSETVTDVPAYFSVRVNDDILWERRFVANTYIQTYDNRIDVSSYGDYCTLEFRLNQTDIGTYDEGIFVYIDNIRTSIWHDVFSYVYSFSNDTVTWHDPFSYLYSFSNDSITTKDVFSYIYSFSNTSVSTDPFSYVYSFSNDSVLTQDIFSYLYSFSNDTISNKDVFSYLYSFSNTSTTQDIFSYLYSFSNSSITDDVFSYIYSFSNDTVSNKDVFSYLFSFSNDTITWQDTFSYTYSFSNTSSSSDSFSYLYSFSNISSTLDIASYIYSFSNSTFGPFLGTPTPSNNSIIYSTTYTWSVLINDTFGTFNWTINCTNGQNNSHSSDINGTKTLNLTGLTNIEYRVWVNVSDGYGYSINEWFNFTVSDLLFCSFTYIVSGSTITASPTFSPFATHYKWEVEDGGKTEWIPVADIHDQKFVLPEGGDYRITLTVKNSTASVEFSRVISTKISPEYIEPEPVIEEPDVAKPKVKNIYKDTGIAEWIEDRNIGEFILIGIMCLFFLLVFFRRRKKKIVHYEVKKRVK